MATPSVDWFKTTTAPPIAEPLAAICPAICPLGILARERRWVHSSIRFAERIFVEGEEEQ